MPANGTEIINRYGRLRMARQQHDERWERMAPYVAPSRVGITGGFTIGESIVKNVYDSTTLMAAELMAQFIAGHIINPSQQWFSYRMRDPIVADDDDVKEWLEECRERSLRNFANSLFYAEGPESLIDYTGFGTGFLLCEEQPQPVNRTLPGFRGFHFRAEKTGRFTIDEGSNGMVDTAYREFQISARLINERWGDSRTGKLPEAVKKALDSGETEKMFTVVHAIYPRSKGEGGYGALGMPWASCWVEKESKTLIHESGYKVFPAAVPRYMHTPGDVYGRGRGDLAFPDTWTLNTAKRMGLEDWALKIRPPVLHGHDSVMGSLRLVPGGPTSVNTHGRPIKDVIAPFETGSRPEVSQLKEDELRKSIRQIFYVDQILMLLEVNKSEMTAYEFARKIELLFRLLGPVYGRTEWEYLYQISEITWDVQLAAGVFPPPPPAVFDTDGNIDVEFQNPLAKAQRSGEAEALLFAINDVAPLSERFPQMWDHLDPDKAMLGIFDIRGVPAKWTRSMDEVEKLREERAKQDQAELQLQNIGGMAQAAGAAAPMVKALQSATANVQGRTA